MGISHFYPLFGVDIHTFSNFILFYVYLIVILLFCFVHKYLCSSVYFISAQLLFSCWSRGIALECWTPIGPLKRMTKEL